MSIENCGHQNSESLTLSTARSFTTQNLSTAEQRAALATIQSEIARHKTCIEWLEKEQNSLKANLALVVYPVLTLPAELTSQIFIDCLPAHGRIIPSPSAVPLVLAQICRQWRDVALSTWELWRSIYLTSDKMDIPRWGRTPREDELSNDRARHLLGTWLSRAKGHPLSLGFHSPLHPLRSPLLSFITAFSAQIQCLELHVLQTQSHQLHEFRARFPLLRRFVTSHLTDEDQRNLLKSVPPLRELRIPGKTHTLNASLPLLTSLEMNLDSPEAFLGILTNFPVLAHLKCCIKVTDIVAEGSRPMFPHLLSLALRGWYAQDALNLVTLPNLRALDLLNFIPREDISSFVSRSSCAIHHLAFAIYKDIDEEELTDWFQLFPTLESLEIRNCYDLAPLIDCLDKPCIFPDLKDITIRSVRAQVRPPLDYDALLDMLRSRKKLRSFVLDIQDLTSEWDSIRDSMRQYSGFPGRLVAAELKDFGLNFLVTVHGQSTRFARSSDPSRGDTFLLAVTMSPLNHISAQYGNHLTPFPEYE